MMKRPASVGRPGTKSFAALVKLPPASVGLPGAAESADLVELPLASAGLPTPTKSDDCVMMKRPASVRCAEKKKPKKKQDDMAFQTESSGETRVSQFNLYIHWDSASVIRRHNNISQFDVRAVLADRFHLPLNHILLKEQKFHIRIEYVFPAKDWLLAELQPQDWRIVVGKLLEQMQVEFSYYNPVTVSSGKVVVCVLVFGAWLQAAESALASKRALVKTVMRGTDCSTPGCNGTRPLGGDAKYCTSCRAEEGETHVDFCEDRPLASSHTLEQDTLKTLQVQSELHLLLEARIEHPNTNLVLSDEILTSLAEVLGCRRVHVPDTIRHVPTDGRVVIKDCRNCLLISCRLCRTKSMDPWSWFCHARSALHYELLSCTKL